MPPPTSIRAAEELGGLREQNSEEQGLLEAGGGRCDWPRGSGLEGARFRVGGGHTSGRDREVESLKQGWERGADFGREISGQGKLTSSALSRLPNEPLE